MVTQVLAAMAMVPRLFDARRARAGKPELLACVIALTTFPAAAQILMPSSSPGGGVRLFNSDAAILEVFKQPHTQPNKMFLHLTSNTPVNTGPPLKKVVRGRQWRFCPPQPVG